MKTLSTTGSRILPTIVRGVLLGVLLSAFFLAGFLFRGAVPAVVASPVLQGATSTPGQYPLLAEVQGLLNQYYFRDQPAQKQLEYGAIRGLLTVIGDKYTFFVDPPVASSESQVLAGQYGGIGVQVQRNEAGSFVLYPFRDSPAAKAGVLDGDVLLQVNGKDVPLTTQQDAVDQMLRGEVKNNNGVTIHVRHQASSKEEDFTIAFAVIEIPSVVWRVLAEESTFGYIQILRFTSRTPDELRQAIQDLRSKQIRALVLDLRNNPGGLLDQSVKVAGEFLDGGVILYEKTRTGETPYEAPKGGSMLDLPMAVLVNQNTASAAELVAAAIHDRKRATLIGQKTYGKGTVQLILPLSDKSSLHVTTAEWLPPSRVTLDGMGVMPDVPMIPDQNGRDVELGEAVRFLRDGTT